jgi:hypothetical protein
MVVSGDVPVGGRRVVGDAVEVLHDSDRALVTRVMSPGGDTVIRKQVRGADGELRVRHERAMLQRLAGLEYVPRLVDADDDDDVLLLVDLGGVALSSVSW